MLRRFFTVDIVRSYSAEPKPEDQVEISFLRQCLENAMATELTPYERDVLRLRLGLDSGEGKTVKEVVEICGGAVTMSGMTEFFTFTVLIMVEICLFSLSFLPMLPRI